MIIGIGVDRVVVSRIRSSLDRFGDRFIRRVYTEHEFEQASSKNDKSRRLALLFASKESVSKALGTGFRQGVAPKAIETIHRTSGKPDIILHGAAKEVASRLGVDVMHVSLSDDDGIAMAFAVAESRPG